MKQIELFSAWQTYRDLASVGRPEEFRDLLSKTGAVVRKIPYFQDGGFSVTSSSDGIDVTVGIPRNVPVYGVAVIHTLTARPSFTRLTSLGYFPRLD